MSGTTISESISLLCVSITNEGSWSLISKWEPINIFSKTSGTTASPLSVAYPIWTYGEVNLINVGLKWLICSWNATGFSNVYKKSPCLLTKLVNKQGPSHKDGATLILNKLFQTKNTHCGVLNWKVYWLILWVLDCCSDTLAIW